MALTSGVNQSTWRKPTSNMRKTCLTEKSYSTDMTQPKRSFCCELTVLKYLQLCRMHKLGQDFACTLQALQALFQFLPFIRNTRILSEQHSWIVPSNHGKHCILKLRDVLVQHVVLDYQRNLIGQTVTGNL